MRVGSRTRTAFVIGLMMLGVSSQAHATLALIPGSGVWRFFGNCTDCAGTVFGDVAPYPVTATLTLQNYIQGQTLVNSNFVSFAYGGSNLLLPYTVPTSFAFVGLTGNLTNGGVEELRLTFSSGGYFDMRSSRTWSTCAAGVNCPLDYGTNGNLVLDTTVPEPSSYALLAFGLGTLGVASTLKKRTR